MSLSPYVYAVAKALRSVRWYFRRTCCYPSKFAGTLFWARFIMPVWFLVLQTSLIKIKW